MVPNEEQSHGNKAMFSDVSPLLWRHDASIGPEKEEIQTTTKRAPRIGKRFRNPT